MKNYLISSMKFKQHLESDLTQSNSKQIVMEPIQRISGILFYIKASGIALIQLIIIWAMNTTVILVHTFKEWLQSTNWFVGLFFFLGLFIDLEIILMPRVQFIFPLNYILLIFNSIILSIPVSRFLCELKTLWIPCNWVITLGITLLTIIFGKLIRFDIQTSLNIFLTVIFTLQAIVYIAMIILNYYGYFDVILIISGSGMLLTIIYELAIATQAIFPGDKRFIFRDNQYFLCGLVLATIMIWMNMIISMFISLTSPPSPVHEQSLSSVQKVRTQNLTNQLSQEFQGQHKRLWAQIRSALESPFQHEYTNHQRQTTNERISPVVLLIVNRCIHSMVNDQSKQHHSTFNHNENGSFHCFITRLGQLVNHLYLSNSKNSCSIIKAHQLDSLNKQK
ncbi:unnamed protein product [Schistosoma bovis]|nr:unnamed protein product [Schistosoma bovis]